MSAKNSAKKVSTFNEANEALYDAFPAVQLPDYFPVNPPWPEWSDAEVNAEPWGNGKGRPQTTAVAKGTGKSQTGLDVLPCYTDPEPGGVPPELERHVAEWRRPHEVFPQGSLTLYDGSAPAGGWTCPSEHGSDCELFRLLSDVCCILRFYASMEPFPTECETPLFTSNTKGQAWQPWHHIYGGCRAGKDVPHRPVYHPYGKYFLRLYYLGAWRRFTVDDRVPCDEKGRPLLPVTQTPGELWPIILVKGVMKIAALTPSSSPRVMNLPVWTLFTGWIAGAYQVRRKTTDQAWRLIHALCPNFEYPEVPPRSSPSISSKGTAKKGPAPPERARGEDGRPALAVAELEDFPPESKLRGELCRSAVVMTRSVPLVRSKPRKATEPWKRIRWVHWAASRGLWSDEDLIPPYRCLYQISFVREVNELMRVDPERESRLFVPDDVTEDGESGQGDPPDLPLQWVDFYKFIAHATKLDFLLKPSSLVSTFRMTYLNLGGPLGRAAGYYTLPTVQMSGNEPPILYCDSVTGIFITVSLWVCPREPLESNSYLSADQPEVLAVYRGSIVVERYDWRSARQGSVVAAVKTVGRTSASIFLNPGRHALRLWLDTDSPFVVELHSNAELTVGKGPKVRFLMSTESRLVMDYVARMSASFIDLVQKFGRPNHAAHLSAFYREVKPRNTITPGFDEKVTPFVDALAAAVSTILRSIVTSEEELRWMVRSLRALFVSPNVPGMGTRSGGSVILQKKGRKEVERERERSTDWVAREWTEEEVAKAVTVQRFFRGFRIRQLIRYRSPSCKDHRTIAEKLRKVCDLIFSPSKRDVEVARLIREVIAAEPGLLETFLFHRDIPNVIVTEEFTGRIAGVEPKAWVPMIRFIFACHSPEPLPCAFYHSCNLEQYTVTVTDNDTNEEIFRLVNSTCPHYYPRNQTGYTLFVYGWNELDPKTVNWRLEMVKMKYFLDIHPCNTALIGVTGNPCHPYQPQPLSVQEIRNFYVPNKRNKICACLIKVRKRVHVTIRLAMSFEDARFHTRIAREGRGGRSESEDSLGDELVIEAEAKSSAIIFPSVLLVHSPGSAEEQQSEQTVYVLEAFVVDSTWPLTSHEWGVVEPFRVNGESWHDGLSPVNVSLSRKSSTGSRRKSLGSSKTGVASQKVVESPYWYLQVVTDVSPDVGSVLEVVEDRSCHDAIKGMKVSWEERDPGRRQRGVAIRRDFLRRIYDEGAELRRLGPAEDGSLSESFGRETESPPLAGEDGFESLLQDMRSFSYLVQDKSRVRHLKSPRILPWMPMEDLVARYSRGRCDMDGVSSAGSSRDLPGEDSVLPDVPRESTAVLEDERKRLLGDMRRGMVVLEEHLAREKALSRQLMEEACEDRRKVIAGMKAGREKVDGKPEVQKTK